MVFPKKHIYSALPLRDIVVFPHMVVPLFVGREKSIKALDEVVKEESPILLVTQKQAEQDNPKAEDIYTVGVMATILQLLKLPDGTIKILTEAKNRVRTNEFIVEGGLYQAVVEPIYDEIDDTKKLHALKRSVYAGFERLVKLNKKISPEILSSVRQIDDYSIFSDTVAAHLPIAIKDKQDLLETLSVKQRLEKIYQLIEGEVDVLNTEHKIRSRVKTQMEKTQKDYYLNEQLKAIHQELGDKDDTVSEAEEFEKKLEKVKLTKEAKERVTTEIKKFKAMNPMSSEATIVRNYIDWILSLPWANPTKLKHNLSEAEKILERDHFGLEKIKERIIEFIAVQQRTKKLKGPILCLVGPPGVGKTSLARSIADATGRKYVRMSLGGVRDEAEIRGHRRTYIGSLPGKILQNMKKIKSSNPLFLLDEIDKLGIDFRGDPASALLEVLDPEQNAHFADHYLEVDYDLSDVLFITTANSLNMPPPLLDRMEIIRLSGYTEDEKIQISLRHLLPKIIKDHGLKEGEWHISEESIRYTIQHYTREAGVRELERLLSKFARKAVKEIISSKGKKKVIHVTKRNVEKFLGVVRFKVSEAEKEDQVGVTTGLAYTESGGDILYIEAVSILGKGNIKFTGKLGEVMQESVQTAYSYVKSRAIDFGIVPTLFQKRDIHVHVPEGATPKDGPSAGVAMCTSIISILTGIPVRKSVAMTGEISLRGRILPIGGLKEKLLAALRSGIKTVLIPAENAKDLIEIPDNVKKGIDIKPVSTLSEVLKEALVKIPDAIEWEEEEVPSIPTPDAEENITKSDITKH